MALQPGVRLGSFEVLGPLGTGGMGEVYRARDTRLGRDVAVKVLPEGFAGDPTRAARFEREARLLAAINHPAIAAIYGAQEFGALHCIVMELIPGETLSERMIRGPLPLEEALETARQIAEALEAAHEKGVIHRDLKPSNIKVTPEGKVKLLDFGLAKAMEQPSPEGPSLSPTMPLEETRPGVVLGTVEFMSPEQARGKPLDKRTDIWAFGCILYEMLSGRRAFTGETAADVFTAILSKEPDWSALPPATPPRIQELLARCLQKDANRRLRDIGDARIDIQQVFSERGSRPPREAARSARAGRLLLLAVVAGGLGVAVVAAWFALRQRTEDRALLPERITLAVLPFRDLSAQPNGQLLADGFAETLRGRLAKLPGIQVVAGLQATDVPQKDADPYRAAASLGANVVVTGSLQRANEQLRVIFGVSNVAQRRQLAGDDVTGQASELFRMQDVLAEQVAGSLKLPSQALRAAKPTGLETASEQERYTQALGSLRRYDKPASLEEGIHLLETLRTEKPDSALVHAGLARAYFYKYSNSRERSWADLAISSADRARRLDPGLPEVDVTLGEVQLRTGQAAQSAAAYQRALQKQPNNYEALLGLGDAYAALGQLSEADATYRRALTLQPSTWSGFNRLGNFYLTHGPSAEAVPLFQRVVALNPDSARGYNGLGAAFHQMNRFQEALAEYRKSISLQPTGSAYSNAGTTEFFLGLYKEAVQDFDKAVALTPTRYGYWQNLADAYYWSSDAPKAQEAYRQAIRLVRADLEMNPLDAGARSRLAICLARTGNVAAAREEIRKATDLAGKNPQVMYNAAIVAHRAGEKKEALVWITRAAAAGYGAELIRREPEFADLRGNSTFEEAVRKSKVKGS